MLELVSAGITLTVQLLLSGKRILYPASDFYFFPSFTCILYFCYILGVGIGNDGGYFSFGFSELTYG